ncbi:RNA-binding protein [Parasalinivibrio latis]|uniref:RNA recognition motif domain-containing protein n=1 Tax=Parasalinivibrio latis TaxID=2952610 RepID=UPI0006D29961
MKVQSRLTVFGLLTAALGYGILEATAIIQSPSMAFALGAVACLVVLLAASDNTSETKVRHTPSTMTDDSSKTLYVGNLPYRANEEDVKKLFSEHGHVFSVRLMKDRRTGKRKGFGFVVMAEGDAPQAVTQLDNSQYGGRTLKVKEANEPKNGSEA